MIKRVATNAALAGVATSYPASAAGSAYQASERAMRRPLLHSQTNAAILQQLVRCATLAANSHNTQPWKFALSVDTVSIHPDLSRRTPAVDPDGHHLWVSLGCAAENLVLAAAALGKHANVAWSPREAHITLENSAPANSPLVDAIFQRQCTRAEYDGQPISNEVLQKLERAANRDGVRLLMLTERAKIENVLGYVTQGNSAQIRNPAFVEELKNWIRFNETEAIASGDGLFSALSGNPTVPRWLGSLLFKMLLSEKSDNDKYARQLRSSPAVAVFVGERADQASWFEVGRAYEHFALTATACGVRNSFLNQPIEVPAVRTQFAQWLGLGTRRPDLVVRIGYGPQLPFSLRRPVADVIADVIF